MPPQSLGLNSIGILLRSPHFYIRNKKRGNIQKFSKEILHNCSKPLKSRNRRLKASVRSGLKKDFMYKAYSAKY